MGKEVAVKQNAEVSTEVLDAGLIDEVYGSYQVDASDIVIPKLLLMQQSSQYVAAEKARLGDFVNSLNGDKLGSIVEPIEIIPFHFRKSWDIVNKDDNNSYLRNEPFTPANAALPWEDKEGAMNIKRIKRLDFFCMVPKMLGAGSVLPMVVSFKSTSYKTGAIILTEWEEMRARNAQLKKSGKANEMKLPFSKSFILAGVKLTNDKKQTYCSSSVIAGIDVPMETQKLCLDWLKTLRTATNIVVDDSEEKEVTKPAGENFTGDF